MAWTREAIEALVRKHLRIVVDHPTEDVLMKLGLTLLLLGVVGGAICLVFSLWMEG